MSQDNQTPQAPQPAPALTVDQWHGMGGEYVMVDGVRTRVGGPPLPTAQQPEQQTNEPA